MRMLLKPSRYSIQAIRLAVSKAAMLGAFAGTCMAAVVEPSGVSSGRWVAWTDFAPKKWEDAFVTGNGRHGMMVMSQPGDGRIICVHEELFLRSWDREKVAVADIAKLLPEVRRLVDEGKTDAAAKLADAEGRRQLTEMGAAAPWTHTPHPAFDLRIRTGDDKDATAIAGMKSVLGNTCTLAAWIKPAAGETGRILDKCTAGVPDGLTFDTYPGLSLRWIVGNRSLDMPNCLKAGEWQHVAARVGDKGELALYLNGKLLKEGTPFSGGGVALPVNALAWKRGADSTGNSRFGGNIAGASISNRSLNDSEIAALAATPPPAPPAGYRRQLDLETGEVVTRWDGYEQRVFSSRSHNVNVVLLRASAGHKLDVTLNLEDTPGILANAFRSLRSEASPGWLSYHAGYAADPGGYEGLARVTAKGGRMQLEEGTRIHVQDAEEILVVMRITPVAGGESYRQDAVRTELTGLSKDYSKLLAPHAREHGAMFRRVTLDLGAAMQWVETPTEKMITTAREQGVTPLLLEQMHAMGRYLLISSSGKYPPPLQGIWGGSWNPAWCGGFVMDANINLAVSAISLGDLPECAESYFGYVERILLGWRLNARKYLGCRGFLVPHYSDPEKGYLNHFNNVVPWMYWPGGAGWNLRPFLQHAQLTGDLDFLKKRVLPLYREMAEFYEDYLVLGTDGRYHQVGISPENIPTGTGTLLCKDATMDVSVAREVFDALIQMGRNFKLDGADIAKWQSYLDKLPAYRINEDGALAEWVDLRYKDIYEHRHSSHLYPIWPGTELLQPGADPALLKAAQVALDRRFMTDTDSAHGLMHVALIAARLHDVEKVRTNLGRFSRRGYVYTGLVTSHYPKNNVYNLDSVLSLPCLLMEMLVYTDPGRIELMPAWPKDFPDGHITGIRVQNGHKLDLVWTAGKLVSATLHPVRDDTCEIRYGDTVKSVSLKAGKPFKFTP